MLLASESTSLCSVARAQLSAGAELNRSIIGAELNCICFLGFFPQCGGGLGVVCSGDLGCFGFSFCGEKRLGENNSR